jgi:zinc transport system ATP-binding protein
MNEQSPLISFEQVTFGYEALPLLSNVSFCVNKGDFAAMVGPNGGGKTTIFKLMLGLIKPLSGTVRVFGLDPRMSCRRIGYVPQQMIYDAQFPVSALDVVLMGRVERCTFGPYSRKDHLLAKEALCRVGLERIGSRAFSELSGGERQRVLIAQALSSEPEMLLFDEPTAHVDYVVEYELYELLKELSAELTILMSSHNVAVVTRYVNRVFCVNRGVDCHQACELTSDHLRDTFSGNTAILKHAANCLVVDHPPHNKSLGEQS